MKRVLFITNSTLYGSGYLDHAETLQDVIVAVAVYQESVNRDLGQAFNLGGQAAQINRVSAT